MNFATCVGSDKNGILPHRFNLVCLTELPQQSNNTKGQEQHDAKCRHVYVTHKHVAKCSSGS